MESFRSNSRIARFFLAFFAIAVGAPAALSSDAAAALPAEDAGPTAANAPIGTYQEAQTYTIYATRIGLVGAHTANRHQISERDHFVALPSRRALNANDSTHDYQVRVCYVKTGRCETAPVFDVGPWNVTDDYWNGAETRESWQDLPRGIPQAQAARLDGYNGGLDGYGREVRSPAGIDLADGTFWDSLGMWTNDWVQVTFLWTDGVAATVRAPAGIAVHSGPNSASPALRTLDDSTRILLSCQLAGSTETGTYGTGAAWNRIDEGGYVSDMSVDSAGVVPRPC